MAFELEEFRRTPLKLGSDIRDARLWLVDWVVLIPWPRIPNYEVLEQVSP